MGLCRLLALAVVVSALSACTDFRPMPYSANYVTAGKLKAADPDGVQLSVAPVTAADGKSLDEGMGCRGAGHVTPPEGQSFESYIHDAMVAELKLAGVYSETAQKSVKLNVTAMDFDASMSGSWDISIDASVGGQPPFSVTDHYVFGTAFEGRDACQQVAFAFGTAVEEALWKVVTDPRFKSGVTGN